MSDQPYTGPEISGYRDFCKIFRDAELFLQICLNLSRTHIFFCKHMQIKTTW